MVHVSHSTPYMQLFREHLYKKYRLAVDAWGADERFVRDVYNPLLDLIRKEVPNEDHQRLYPYPIWTLPRRVEVLTRNILVGEFMVKEWAEHFRRMDEVELDRVAQSFKFENCVEREGLNRVLRAHASQLTTA